MSVVAVDETTEQLFRLETRKLPAPDGGTLAFTGFQLMWRAFDLLFFDGNWPRVELVALALRQQREPTFDPTGLQPENPLVFDILSQRHIDILECRPSIDTVKLWSLAASAQGTELDVCMHKVVASLYQDLPKVPERFRE